MCATVWCSMSLKVQTKKKKKKKKTGTHALNFFAMDDSSIQESSYPSLSMINFSIYNKVICLFALYLPHRMAALPQSDYGRVIARPSSFEH